MKEGTFRNRLRDTVLIVEANSYERLALWREFAAGADELADKAEQFWDVSGAFLSRLVHDQLPDDALEYSEAVSEARRALRNQLDIAPRRVNWSDHKEGVLLTIGQLDGMPVTLELTFAGINNCGVMFFHSPSVVTDARMVDEWLAENCNPPEWGGGRPARCGATNFHQCIRATEEYRDRCMAIIERAQQAERHVPDE